MPFVPLSQTDPFTQVHSAIWGFLAGYAPWAALVRPGARINEVTAGTLAAKSPALTPGATPEMRIVQSRFGQKTTNSQAIFLAELFTFQVSTFNMNVVALNQVKFYTLIAVAKMPNDLGLYPLVSDFRISDGTEKSIDPETGLRQWESVVSYQCAFRISNDDLVNL
jgi:hypothetical protein